MNTDRPFHFVSPVSFHAWHGDAAIAYDLLAEWGWVIERREPASSEAIAQFLTSAPEPGATDMDMREPAVLSHWHDWHLLVFYFSFGGLREIYTNYPVPIIEFTVPADSDLSHLGNAPDFHIDLMVDQHYYFAYIRDGVLWRDQMQEELSGLSNGRLILQGDTPMGVEWQVNLNQFPEYGSNDPIVFSANLGLNLQVLGLPFQHWQNRDQDIVNEKLDILSRSSAIPLT